MKMRLTAFMMGILAAGVAGSLASGTALASGADMARFYGSLEGYWRGGGVQRTLQYDGSLREEKFDLRVDFRDHFNQTWEVRNERRQNGLIEYSGYFFGVRGENLLVGDYQPTEPVEVLESTPQTLTYRMTRYDGATGRVYRYTYRLEQRRGGQVLGRNTIDLNGVTVREDSFTLGKW
jgi:hypothetical protein